MTPVVTAILSGDIHMPCHPMNDLRYIPHGNQSPFSNSLALVDFFPTITRFVLPRPKKKQNTTFLISSGVLFPPVFILSLSL